MMLSISGRTAIVTGAGNGLGRAISIELAREGATVALIGRQRPKLESVARELEQMGARAIVVQCDTSDPVSVDVARDALTDEEVSILINNAGVAGPVAPLVDIDPSDWDDVFAVNVRGVFLMCREFLPQMIARGRGDIINVSSVAAKRPLAARTPYGASKAALLGLTATLAVEVAPLGVSVNAISPGPIAGPRMSRNFALEAARRGIPIEQAEEEYVSRAASKRMVTEGEVGRAVVGMLGMSGLIGADLDLTAGMIAR
ncbi:SDR family oxidoreductase [Agromyces sp. NPDC049794]|uniref:SDR family NAD(P)-dependent oxidoreductase n=1 Tax=unclassified Agromyces TaxID=2639701 RepID=UPI0033E6F4E5